MRFILKKLDFILVGLAIAALVAFVLYNVHEHGIHTM